MPEDLSYLLETPSEEEAQRVQKAVEQECLRAISTYLGEVADTMDANNVPHITAENLRSMASILFVRIYENDQEESTSSD